MGAQGTTVVDFGSGGIEAQTVVTGQAGISAGSLVEAWLFPVATATHSPDEHRIEDIRVTAGAVVAGTGFTIYARHEGRPKLPGQEVGGRGRFASRRGSRLNGQYTVAWVWN